MGGGVLFLSLYVLIPDKTLFSSLSSPFCNNSFILYLYFSGDDVAIIISTDLAGIFKNI